MREMFPLVNALISQVKKVFEKAMARIAKFKEAQPNLRLPPEPVVTRWGTWLQVTTLIS